MKAMATCALVALMVMGCSGSSDDLFGPATGGSVGWDAGTGGNAGVDAGGDAGGGTGGTNTGGNAGQGGDAGGAAGQGGNAGGGGAGGCAPVAEQCDFVDNDCNGTLDDPPCMGVEIAFDTCHAWIHTDAQYNIIAADSSPDQPDCGPGTKKFFVAVGDRILIWDDDATETLKMSVAPATIAVRSTANSNVSHTGLVTDLQNGTFSTGAPQVNVVDLQNGYKTYTITHSTGGPNHEWRLVF